MNRKLVICAASLAALVVIGGLYVGCESTSLSRATRAPAPQALASVSPQYAAGTPRAMSRMEPAVMRSAPPGTLPSLDEEVWVIVRPDEGAQPDLDEPVPGCGAMMGVRPQPDGVTQVPLPLAHTEVGTSISAYVASVNVTQQFRNPYDSKIEAVYVFPLPQNAAVNGFVMTVGERKIRGIIRQRQEAEQIYAEAKHQGYVAALLTQERPNIFTQHVANIEPGAHIDVDIAYFHTLAYDDGWYEYVFPMVVGPRFNPPGSTDGVGAVGRGRQGASGQRTEIQYLKPNERSGHDIGLTVDLDVGVPIEEITSVNHRVDVSREASTQVRVTLSPDDTIPNKDFVLRYRVAGDQVKTALLTHRDDRGGFFTLMLFPPQELAALPRRAVEMIFVIDCSGSMSGAPLAQARAAIDHALGQLQPQDTFQVIRFSNDASQFGRAPMPATAENLRRGQRYVHGLRADGGTMMIKGITAALDFPHDEQRLRFVTFLTDGYIGNEAEILGAVHDRLGASRIFSFGVGSSPNRYLMNRMAKLGNGSVAYLALTDDGAEVMDRFFERISHPVLTDLEIDWGGLAVDDVVPDRVPDLFVGRPIVLAGRFHGDGPATVRIRGRAGDRVVESTYEVNPLDDAGRHEALASLWARRHIAELSDRATWDAGFDVEREVTAVALEYGLMSAFTSFVAVDSKTRTAGAYGTTVPVAVPVPDGVLYETTVGGQSLNSE